MSFLSERELQMVLDEKSLQEYSVNSGVPQDTIFGPTFFPLYINNLPDDVISYSEYSQASNLWQQLEMAS